MSFLCRRCGSCCRWEGAVVLEADEVDPIAAELQLSPEEFLERFTRITPDRTHLSLTEKPDGSCIFLHGEPGKAYCLVNAVKPRQCRGFPEHWNFPGWQKCCPGANQQESYHDRKKR